MGKAKKVAVKKKAAPIKKAAVKRSVAARPGKMGGAENNLEGVPNNTGGN